MDNIYNKTRWQSILINLKKQVKKNHHSLTTCRVLESIQEKQREMGDIRQSREQENAKEPIDTHWKAWWGHVKTAAKTQSGFSHPSSRWMQMLDHLRSCVILDLMNSQKSPARVLFLNTAAQWREMSRSWTTLKGWEHTSIVFFISNSNSASIL